MFFALVVMINMTLCVHNVFFLSSANVGCKVFMLELFSVCFLLWGPKYSIPVASAAHQFQVCNTRRKFATQFASVQHHLQGCDTSRKCGTTVTSVRQEHLRQVIHTRISCRQRGLTELDLHVFMLFRF